MVMQEGFKLKETTLTLKLHFKLTLPSINLMFVL